MTSLSVSTRPRQLFSMLYALVAYCRQEQEIGPLIRASSVRGPKWCPTTPRPDTIWRLSNKNFNWGVVPPSRRPQIIPSSSLEMPPVSDHHGLGPPISLKHATEATVVDKVQAGAATHTLGGVAGGSAHAWRRYRRWQHVHVDKDNPGALQVDGEHGIRDWPDTSHDE
jgi:hypothetical protein